MNKNLCIDAMHLHHTILSPLSERSINSETMFESDSSTIPTYFINSPVVKLLKTSKNKQQTYLDNGLQLENKVMQRISSIFQDKKAIQDLLREMNAYYLTYGRPRKKQPTLNVERMFLNMNVFILQLVDSSVTVDI
ncbi:hypothetical protein Smp_153580 [Schistosoma mansoni]|uniref:hypothetical protein n=1 Tax=Schistosoma mansoni TaxID=6183 RepID=UPI0001A63F46|nr:hypothetical protein Smp_153580 [Schistosoma mansoni]|eukprot:XP_018654805.1 hypothetical protein Smp_153580 [Schistosoma mansoni]